MGLKDQLLDDIKQAMKAKEQAKLAVLRLLSAAIKQKEVDSRAEVSDQDILAIIEKQIKQRKEAAAQFQQGGREDSANQELAEAQLLSTYLPEQLSEDEIASEIQRVVASVGATGPQDMGKVMGPIKTALQGRADMSLVSKLVKKALIGQTHVRHNLGYPLKFKSLMEDFFC